jgi:hypothetical protein
MPDEPLDPPTSLPVWSPESSVLLGKDAALTEDEYAPFSHSITYTWDQYPGVVFRVVLVPSEPNPETVFISGNNISGYYTDVFDVDIKYKTKKYPQNEYINVRNFRKIDQEKLEQVISYKPDLTPSKIYTYTANVYNGNVLVDSKVYTKTINNNWDLNKTLLLQYINSTVITDEALFRPWINSINGAIVKWKNSSNVDINWA